MNQKHNEYCLLKTCYLDKDNFTKLRIYGDIFTLPEVRSLYAIMDDNYNRVGDWDRRGIEKIIIESHCMSIEDYHEIIESDARAEKYSYFFELVFIEHIKLKSKDLFRDLTQNNYKNINDFKEALANLNSKIFVNEEKEVKSNKELLIKCLQNLGKPVKKILSGIWYFDTKENGFYKGEVCIIAARTNVGKTSYARNIMLNQIKHNLKPLFFSAEMNEDQITTYLACTYAEVNKLSFEMKQLKPEDEQRTIDRMNELYEKEYYIDGTRAIEIEDLKRKARIYKKKHNIDSIFVDYLQELSYASTRYHTEYEKLSIIAMELSKLANELEVPIFVLAQLNRDSAGGKPKLQDLKGSGKIEECADRVILLDIVNVDDKNNCIMDCTVAKNRYGKKDFTYRCRFERNISKITDLERILLNEER